MPPAADDTDLLALPLSEDQLPEALRRYVAASAPAGARKMAARGALPLAAADLLTVVAQLSVDADAAIGELATQSLGKLPAAVVLEGCEKLTLAPVLHQLAQVRPVDPALAEVLSLNPHVAGATLCYLARTGGEEVTERLALNETRLIAEPTIIEALYHNPATRMSTADRIVELAARHELALPSIPAMAAIVEALASQIVFDAGDGPLPGDVAFRQSIEEDGDETDVVDDSADDGEQVKEKYLPLQNRIAAMGTSEKLRMALVGNATARALLVRDNDKNVSMAAISSPKTTDAEAAAIANSREVSEEILRYIGRRREWLRSHEVKRALVFNPKTPVGISLKFIEHMREGDLKKLAKSRNVQGPIKVAAGQRLARKSK